MNTILGIILGFMVGNLLFNGLVLIFSVNPNTLYWIAIIIGIVGVVILANLIKDTIVAIISSLIGSYMIVRVSINF